VKDLINLGENVNNINAREVIKALNWRYELFKIKVYKHVVDFKEMDELMQESNRVLRESIQSGVITSEMFTISEINYLDDLVYGSGVRPQATITDDEDTPF
jgi:serine/threonine-protein kinase RIO1